MLPCLKYAFMSNNSLNLWELCGQLGNVRHCTSYLQRAAEGGVRVCCLQVDVSWHNGLLVKVISAVLSCCILSKVCYQVFKKVTCVKGLHFSRVFVNIGTVQLFFSYSRTGSNTCDVAMIAFWYLFSTCDHYKKVLLPSVRTESAS